MSWPHAHQAYLIARIRPWGTPPGHPGYRRCIAALDHRWCFNTLPLRAMKRLVDLVSQPENAVVIRAELRALEGKYGAHTQKYPFIPPVPCPYAASLLAVAWNAALEPGNDFYSSGQTPESDLMEAHMGYWDEVNNEGLSVLDITDPEKPEYCFDQHVYGLLNAEGYLKYGLMLERRYSNEEDAMEAIRGDESLVRCIRDLDTVPLINIGALCEAWPSQATTKVSSGSFRHIEPRATDDSVSAGRGSPSLADLTLDVAVKYQLEVDDVSTLEKFLWLPGKAARAKATLRGVKKFGPAAVQLLAVVLAELEEVTSVDLSGFCLSASQIKILLSGIANVEYLNLSDNRMLTADDVPGILESVHNLRRLVLMGCSSIDPTRLLKIVRRQPSSFTSLEGILHPAFLEIEKPASYPSAFAYMATTMRNKPTWVSIPFFTPAQVVQALTILLQQRTESYAQEGDGEFDHGLPFVGCAAFQAGTLSPGQRFGTRVVTTVPLLTPKIPRGEKELWTFMILSPGLKSMTGWGFVHFIAHDEVEETASDPLKQSHGYSSWTIHDLEGFLDCMKLEGRPMPAPQAVKNLEDLLTLKNPQTGDYYYPLMDQLDMCAIEASVNSRTSGRYGKRLDI